MRNLFSRKMLDRTGERPLYLQVYEAIRKIAQSPEAKTIERLPTTAELAAMFGVGENTIRTAMRLLAEEQIVCRIKHRGTVLTAQQNPADPQANSRALALVFPTRGGIWKETIEAMQDEAVRNGCSLDLYLYDWGNLNDEQRAVARAVRHCAGLVLYPNSIGSDDSLVRELEKRKYPFVLFCLYFEKIDCNIVANNNFQGARELTETLFARGCRRIALLGEHGHLQTMRSRVEGYRKAHEKLSVETDPRLVFLSTDSNASSDGFSRFLSETKPDAVICSNPAFLPGVQSAADRVHLPSLQYGVFHLSGADSPAPAEDVVTAVIQTGELGRAAIEQLCHQIRNRSSARRKIILNMKIEPAENEE